MRTLWKMRRRLTMGKQSQPNNSAMEENPRTLPLVVCQPLIKLRLRRGLLSFAHPTVWRTVFLFAKLRNGSFLRTHRRSKSADKHSSRECQQWISQCSKHTRDNKVL